MEQLQEQMNAILSDPQMMQTIMGLAQSMNNQQQEQPKAQAPANEDLDIAMLQKITGFAQKSRIDSNQKNLLNALGPYLSSERIGKLERAMRAAKLAQLASVLFAGQQHNQGG